ncbi:2-dehydro-3-deoxygluconokinase [Gramella sp. Hel_I_59]|uniref:sugar kinase n=1 Tax=Gramella sp. Hel_I_59 TaxID=1249978 RepID=UPI001154D783|nr:sugar kinase [Gramella sp. Hel_I_59]TQI69323.1 2-dehydro-3-deoxygluconokinase [Gramella sp. Hel_I_59]
MKSNTRHIGKVVTFGEVLMRLSPAENRKLQQSNQMDFFFGGTEMNVAASLCQFGLQCLHVTNVSDDLVGDAAIASMRQLGINVTAVNRVDHPLGLYFLEVGSSARSSKIAYNRLHGAFANITEDTVNWEDVLEDCSHFHWTGITPAISEGAYHSLRKALEVAKTKNITVTADPAYRSNLWKYGKNGHQILKELVCSSTIFIGGVNEINEILGTNYSYNKEQFIEASKRLMEECPSITKVFDKIRTGLSASWQKIYGQAWTGTAYISTEELEITSVVDRIGTGDAYAAGILYGLQNYDDQKTLDFANAACALKHTILGDANLVSVDEVLDVMKGNTGGRIKR